MLHTHIYNRFFYLFWHKFPFFYIENQLLPVVIYDYLVTQHKAVLYKVTKWLSLNCSIKQLWLLLVDSAQGNDVDDVQVSVHFFLFVVTVWYSHWVNWWLHIEYYISRDPLKLIGYFRMYGKYVASFQGQLCKLSVPEHYIFKHIDDSFEIL